MLDVNGGVYFAHTFSQATQPNNSHPKKLAVIGVTYDGHFYPVTTKDTNLWTSIACRFRSAGDTIYQKPEVVSDVRLFETVPPKKGEAEVDSKKPGRKSKLEGFSASMTNTASDPVINPSFEDLLTDELAFKHVCFTNRRVTLNDVYDFLVQNGRVCQGGGLPTSAASPVGP